MRRGEERGYEWIVSGTHRCWLGWLTPCSTFDRAPVRVRANHAMASLAEGLPPPKKKPAKSFLSQHVSSPCPKPAFRPCIIISHEPSSITSDLLPVIPSATPVIMTQIPEPKVTTHHQKNLHVTLSAILRPILLPLSSELSRWRAYDGLHRVPQPLLPAAPDAWVTL